MSEEDRARRFFEGNLNRFSTTHQKIKVGNRNVSVATPVLMAFALHFLRTDSITLEEFKNMTGQNPEMSNDNLQQLENFLRINNKETQNISPNDRQQLIDQLSNINPMGDIPNLVSTLQKNQDDIAKKYLFIAAKETNEIRKSNKHPRDVQKALNIYENDLRRLQTTKPVPSTKVVSSTAFSSLNTKEFNPPVTHLKENPKTPPRAQPAENVGTVVTNSRDMLRRLARAFKQRGLTMEKLTTMPESEIVAKVRQVISDTPGSLDVIQNITDATGFLQANVGTDNKTINNESPDPAVQFAALMFNVNERTRNTPRQADLTSFDAESVRNLGSALGVDIPSEAPPPPSPVTPTTGRKRRFTSGITTQEQKERDAKDKKLKQALQISTQQILAEQSGDTGLTGRKRPLPRETRKQTASPKTPKVSQKVQTLADSLIGSTIGEAAPTIKSFDDDDDDDAGGDDAGAAGAAKPTVGQVPIGKTVVKGDADKGQFISQPQIVPQQRQQPTIIQERESKNMAKQIVTELVNQLGLKQKEQNVQQNVDTSPMESAAQTGAENVDAPQATGVNLPQENAANVPIINTEENIPAVQPQSQREKEEKAEILETQQEPEAVIPQPPLADPTSVDVIPYSDSLADNQIATLKLISLLKNPGHIERGRQALLSLQQAQSKTLPEHRELIDDNNSLVSGTLSVRDLVSNHHNIDPNAIPEKYGKAKEGFNEYKKNPTELQQIVEHEVLQNYNKSELQQVLKHYQQKEAELAEAEKKTLAEQQLGIVSDAINQGFSNLHKQSGDQHAVLQGQQDTINKLIDNLVGSVTETNKSKDAYIAHLERNQKILQELKSKDHGRQQGHHKVHIEEEVKGALDAKKRKEPVNTSLEISAPQHLTLSGAASKVASQSGTLDPNKRIILDPSQSQPTDQPPHTATPPPTTQTDTTRHLQVTPSGGVSIAPAVKYRVVIPQAPRAMDTDHSGPVRQEHGQSPILPKTSYPHHTTGRRQPFTFNQTQAQRIQQAILSGGIQFNVQKIRLPPPSTSQPADDGNKQDNQALVTQAENVVPKTKRDEAQIQEQQQTQMEQKFAQIQEDREKEDKELASHKPKVKGRMIVHDSGLQTMTVEHQHADQSRDAHGNVNVAAGGSPDGGDQPSSDTSSRGAVHSHTPASTHHSSDDEIMQHMTPSQRVESKNIVGHMEKLESDAHRIVQRENTPTESEAGDRQQELTRMLDTLKTIQKDILKANHIDTENKKQLLINIEEIEREVQGHQDKILAQASQIRSRSPRAEALDEQALRLSVSQDFALDTTKSISEQANKQFTERLKKLQSVSTKTNKTLSDINLTLNNILTGTTRFVKKDELMTFQKRIFEINNEFRNQRDESFQQMQDSFDEVKTITDEAVKLKKEALAIQKDIQKLKQTKKAEEENRERIAKLRAEKKEKERKAAEEFAKTQSAMFNFQREISSAQNRRPTESRRPAPSQAAQADQPVSQPATQFRIQSRPAAAGGGRPPGDDRGRLPDPRTSAEQSERARQIREAEEKEKEIEGIAAQPAIPREDRDLAPMSQIQEDIQNLAFSYTAAVVDPRIAERQNLQIMSGRELQILLERLDRNDPRAEIIGEILQQRRNISEQRGLAKEKEIQRQRQQEAFTFAGSPTEAQDFSRPPAFATSPQGSRSISRRRRPPPPDPARQPSRISRSRSRLTRRRRQPPPRDRGRLVARRPRQPPPPAPGQRRPAPRGPAPVPPPAPAQPPPAPRGINLFPNLPAWDPNDPRARARADDYFAAVGWNNPRLRQRLNRLMDQGLDWDQAVRRQAGEIANFHQRARVPAPARVPRVVNPNMPPVFRTGHQKWKQLGDFQHLAYGDHPNFKNDENWHWFHHNIEEFHPRNQTDVDKMKKYLSGMKGVLYYVDTGTGRKMQISIGMIKPLMWYVFIRGKTGHTTHEYANKRGGGFTSVLLDSLHQENANLGQYHYLRGASDKAMYQDPSWRAYPGMAPTFHNKTENMKGAGFFDFFKNLGSRLWDGIKTVGKGLWHGIEKAVDGTGRFIVQTGKDIGRGVVNLGSSIGKGVVGIGRNVWDGVKSMGHLITHPTLSNLGRTIGGLGNNVLGIGKSIMNTLGAAKDFVTQTPIIKNVYGLTRKFIPGVDMLEKGIDVGRNMVNGNWKDTGKGLLGMGVPQKIATNLAGRVMPNIPGGGFAEEMIPVKHPQFVGADQQALMPRWKHGPTVESANKLQTHMKMMERQHPIEHYPDNQAATKQFQNILPERSSLVDGRNVLRHNRFGHNKRKTRGSMKHNVVRPRYIGMFAGMGHPGLSVNDALDMDHHIQNKKIKPWQAHTKKINLKKPSNKMTHRERRKYYLREAAKRAHYLS